MNTEQPEPISFLDAIRREWTDAGLLSTEPAPLPQELTPEQKEQQVRDYVRAQRMEAFKANCPEEFRKKIDRTLLPNLDAWEKSDQWDGSFPGVWLWSKGTGRGKTRMLWRQFGRLHVEHGKTILKITGQALAEEYFRYHMNGYPREFYSWVSKYDIIMLDDLDKLDIDDKRAPRMCRELFDEFYARHKPVLVTANEPIAHFQKRIGDSTARRMTSVCSEIQFDYAK